MCTRSAIIASIVASDVSGWEPRQGWQASSHDENTFAGVHDNRRIATFGVGTNFGEAAMPSEASTLQQRSEPNLLVGVRRGVARKCPGCGKGELFCGYLAIRPVCPVCANDNEQYPSDDFAPYVTIFLVLHLMVPIFVAADRTWDMSMGFEAAVALPIFLIATLLLLPVAKGAVIGFAWSRGVTRNSA